MFRSLSGFSYPLRSIAVLFFGNSVIYYVFLLSKVPSSSCMTYFHFSAYDEPTASAKLCCSINYTKFALMLLSIFLLSMSVPCCQTLSDVPFGCPFPTYEFLIIFLGLPYFPGFFKYTVSTISVFSLFFVTFISFGDSFPVVSNFFSGIAIILRFSVVDLYIHRLIMP